MGHDGRRLRGRSAPAASVHVPYRPAEPVRPARKRGAERPMWQGIAALLLTIAVLVVVTVALAYVVADLVTGVVP